MKHETPEAPQPTGKPSIIDACDAIGRARDVLDLLYLAGAGIHAEGGDNGGCIVYGATLAKAALDEALTDLNALIGGAA